MSKTHRKSTITLVFFFLITWCQVGQAQIYEIINYIRRVSTATEQIAELHEGTLVVNLVSKHNNIQAIDDILDRDRISDKSRKRLEKKRAALIEDQRRANTEIAKAMADYYHFSEYRLVYDTAATYVSGGVPAGYFLNQQLKVDPSITIDSDKPIYVLRFGLANYTETNRFEGFIISDRHMHDLSNPFPYYVISKYPAFSSVSSFFGKNEEIFPDFTKMIQTLNNKLTSYYNNSLIFIERKKLKKQIRDLKEIE